MGRYRKKPVVVEAVQWWKHGDHPAVQQYGESIVEQYPAYAACGFIDTLEGRMHVRPSAWIIAGVKGEEYPCEPDIFAATYEPAPQDGAVPSSGETERVVYRDLSGVEREGVVIATIQRGHQEYEAVVVEFEACFVARDGADEVWDGSALVIARRYIEPKGATDAAE